MKYKLLINSNESTHQVTCACGKCIPAVYVDEEVKEDFKKLMNWDEIEFIKYTIIVQEK